MICRRLLFAVAAVSLAAPTAHADALDDRFLGLLATDGVDVANPVPLIGIAHQRCSDNVLGHDRGVLPRFGYVPSPFSTAIRSLESRLMAQGLTPPQADHFMQDAVSVYCPEPPES
jgi:hypothetical protein